MLVDLSNENFQKETESGLKLVDFYTTWCKFCTNQEKILKDLSDNGFWIGRLDCDKFPEIARKHGITGFPSFILFKNGRIEAQFTGYHDKSQLLNRLTMHI
ncbi:MAG: thioredoxin family protein [Candidatus Gastranaerophilales bacterium]|nr:thioredoxin family protein [Candidatus Gastranaerophilales bacterium]